MLPTANKEEQLFTQHVGKVSYFSYPISNTRPDNEFTLREVYEYICGEALKDTTIELRKTKQQNSKKYKVQKGNCLPYVTFGGTFRKRADSQLKEKSGLMCFDIDHLDKIEFTKRQLLEDPNLGTVLLFTSPGGDGLKLVIRSPDEDNYKESYQNSRGYLKTKHDITTDSTQDISRACFLCHDPNAYFNEDAPTTRLPRTTSPTSLKLSRPEAHNIVVNSTSGGTEDIEKVEAYITALEDKKIDITEDYHDWVNIGFSFAALDEAGRALFHRLSRMHAEYTFAEADKKFTNLLHKRSGRVSLSTFYYYCHKIGVKPPQAMSSNSVTPPLPSAKQGSTLSNIKPIVADIDNATNRSQNTDHTSTDTDWDEVLRSHQIKPTDQIPIPPIAWKNGEATCGTLGNFSLIIGKAKSRKSFFVCLAVAGILKPDAPRNPFSGALPKKKNKVIYFDTEQGKYHVHCALKRICTMVGDKGPPELLVYALRPMSPQDRMAAIHHAITTTEGLGVVIIDGIADLQSNINDPEQAVMVATKLLKWTELSNIHIITVLHENKGDRNARGHLGTELVNKAETTLSVTKDKVNPDISIVEPEYCRNKEPAPFAFEIDDNGLPIESRSYALRTGKTVKAENLVDDAVEEIFKLVFAKNDKVYYGSLWQGIKLIYHGLYTGTLSDNQAKATVERAKYSGIICQDKVRGPYFLCKEEG